jgi:hypothetical protein
LYCVDLVKRFSNGALIAKIGVDIAEIEPINFHFVLVNFSLNLHIRIPPHYADAGVRVTSKHISEQNIQNSRHPLKLHNRKTIKTRNGSKQSGLDVAHDICWPTSTVAAMQEKKGQHTGEKTQRTREAINQHSASSPRIPPANHIQADNVKETSLQLSTPSAARLNLKPTQALCRSS